MQNGIQNVEIKQNSFFRHLASKMSTKYRIWPEKHCEIAHIYLVIYNSQRMQNNQMHSQTALSEQIYESEPQSNYCPSVSDEQCSKKRQRWTPEQNIRYAQFLKNNIEAFQTPQLRKKCMVFSKLAKFMTKRTTSQAKSHHQKMMLRHKQVDKVIQYIDNRFVKKLKKEGKKRVRVLQLSQQVNVVENQAEIESIIENFIKEGIRRKEQQEQQGRFQWFEDL